MARSLGLLALAAPVLAIGWLVLPHDEQVSLPAVAITIAMTWTLSAVALGGGFDRAPLWVFQALVGVAPLLVCPFILYSNNADSGFVLLFVWAAPYAFCWFSMPWAISQTAFAGAAFLAARLLSPYRDEPLAEVLADTTILVATIAAVGLFAHALVVAARRQEGRSTQRARRLAEFGQASLDATDPQAVLDDALRIAREELRADYTLLARDDCGAVLLEASAGPPGYVPRPIGSEVPGGRASLLARAMRQGSMVSDDLWNDPRLEPVPGLVDSGLRAGISVAVPGRGGERLGALGAYSAVRGHFSLDDTAFLQSLANLVAAAKSHVAVEAELRHRALHDPLTELPNRILLADRLERALLGARRRPGEHVAVILVDVDRFKHVNDSLGHPVGDELLTELAARLSSSVRGSDTLARMGGDEFVVVAEGVTSESHALEIAHRVSSAWTAPLAVGGRSLHVQASVGVALSHATASADELLANADAAMYRGKALGSGRVELFDDGLRESVSMQLRVEQELRRAIDAGQLLLHYQPIVEPATLRCRSVEALVRWQHPQRGLIGPGEFITVAEESGLIVDLGSQVLDLALAQVARWRSDPSLADMTVSVNVSTHQLRGSGFADEVATLLARHGLPPGALVMEITERVLLLPGGPAAKTAQALRALGVTLALDDFGTGFSSLSSLRSLPVSSLKIDRSFVAGLGVDEADTGVVSGILRMARGARLRVVAEGVETSEQARLLVAMGCDAAQGYFYSRPVDAGEAGAFLRIAPAARA